MGFWKGFGIGFKTFFEAIGFVFSKGLWWTFAFPILFNILLFWGGNELVELADKNLQAWILGFVNFDGADTWYTSALHGIITGSVWLILKILFFSIFTYFGGYIILIFMSPVFAILSEKTEKILTGKTYPFTGAQLMRDMVRGITIVIRNIFIELAIVVVIFLLSLIPVFGWLFGIFSTIILIFVSAYFYGFSYMDYTLERKKLSVKESVRFVRKHKGIAISNGLIFALTTFPFCGVFIAPFISVFSVVGATLAIQKTELADK
jgi:CysZ protein